MVTILIANLKGGVGKTLICACLASRAAQENNHVAVVDIDPQQSLAAWFARRKDESRPEIFTGADDLSEAVAALQISGQPVEYLFCDSPPAFMELLSDAIAAADFVIIPTRPAPVDLGATQDVIALCRDQGKPFLVVLNAVGGGKDRMAEEARRALTKAGVTTAKAEIGQRVSLALALGTGKSPAEGKDKAAVAEIDALWREVKGAIAKAAKSKGGKL